MSGSNIGRNISARVETLGTSKEPLLKVRYAKGVGDIYKPLDILESKKMESGQTYSHSDTHAFSNTIILTEQTGVSVNNTPIVIYPERTAFYIRLDTHLMFDRSTIILTTNSEEKPNIIRAIGVSIASDLDLLDGVTSDNIAEGYPTFFPEKIKLVLNGRVQNNGLSAVLFEIEIFNGTESIYTDEISIPPAIMIEHHKSFIHYIREEHLTVAHHPGHGSGTFYAKMTATGGDLEQLNSISKFRILLVKDD